MNILISNRRIKFFPPFAELSAVLTTMNHGTPPDPSMLQNMIKELVLLSLSSPLFVVLLVKLVHSGTSPTQDTDGNGTVELEEFLQWNMRNKGEDGVENLRAVFDIFDKNKDGYIDMEELSQVQLSCADPSCWYLIAADDYDQVMKEIGERLAADEIVEMMDNADLDKDGLISFEVRVKITNVAARMCLI